MENQSWQLFPKRPWLTAVLLALLFLAALGIRLYDLTDLPNDFYMVRQYRAMIISRGMYYQHLDTVPSWQRDMAVSQWRQEGLIEPPIMESLAAFTYHVTGVQTWVGRLYASLFWLAGGLGLWLLAREMSMRAGGLLAVAYFLFVPFGVTVSRAFLPDPLMVALTVWALWALYRWEKRHTWAAAILAGILTGVAILVKSNAVFLLLGAAVGLVVSRFSWKRILADRQTWVVIGITAAPTVLYYIYGFLTSNLAGQFGLRFFPAYWSDPTFYGRWIFMAAGFAGFAAMLGALAGILLYPTNRERFTAIGLWVGYIAMGFTFSYHYLTHDYYHLPLLLVVAFGLIPLGDLVVRRLTEQRPGLWRGAFTAILILGIAMQMWVSRNSMKVVDYRDDSEYYRDLGNVIGHNKKIVELSGDYGYRLAYWGWVSGRLWPSLGDVGLRELAGHSAPEFTSEFANYTAGEELFVITSLDELDRQPQLRDYLAANYPVLSQGEGYLIYNLAH